MKMTSCLLMLVATASLYGMSACSGREQRSTSVATASEAKTETSRFDADSAYRYVSDQVAFGVRVPGSEGHCRCGDWLVSRLKQWGYTVTEQAFSGKDYFGNATTGRNIIATMKPEAKERVLLMAHWDTRAVADHDPNESRRAQPILGADDGASGVGVLLELARQHRLSSFPIEPDFVFFDLEDGGNSGDNDSWCLGSQHWARHPHQTGYKAEFGILLDMVGAKGAKFYWEGYSKAYAAPLLYRIWDTARSLGLGSYFVNADGGEMIDDHIPVIRHQGIPSVDIINYNPQNFNGFGEHWHTHGDNLNIISRETLGAVGATVAKVLDSTHK